MPKVTFLPSKKEIDVTWGTTLFDAAHQAGLPVASSCNGDGVCGKCAMQVVSGGDKLSESTPLEEKLLKKERHPPTDRISCQVEVQGDCTVTTRYW